MKHSQRLSGSQRPWDSNSAALEAWNPQGAWSHPRFSLPNVLRALPPHLGAHLVESSHWGMSRFRKKWWKSMEKLSSKILWWSGRKSKTKLVPLHYNHSKPCGFQFWAIRWSWQSFHIECWTCLAERQSSPSHKSTWPSHGQTAQVLYQSLSKLGHAKDLRAKSAAYFWQLKESSPLDASERPPDHQPEQIGPAEVLKLWYHLADLAIIVLLWCFLK